MEQASPAIDRQTILVPALPRTALISERRAVRADQLHSRLRDEPAVMDDAALRIHRRDRMRPRPVA